MKLWSQDDYPTHVRIGDEEYRISFRKYIPKSDNAVGLCDPEKQVIYIKKGQSAAETYYTFIHEVLHAFEFELDIKLDHRTVYKLERALGDFCLQNF